MRRSLISVLAIAALVVGPPAYSVTLDELNAILAKAKTIGEFLASKPLRDEYFEALNLYYGKPITRSAYDGILEKTEMLCKTVPGFAEKAWSPQTQTTFLVPFTIESKVQTSGRSLAAHAWNDYLSTWMGELRGKAAVALGMTVAQYGQAKSEDLDRKIKEKLFELHSRILSLKAEYAPKLTGKTRGAQKVIEHERDQKIRKLLEQPETQGLAAYLAHRALASEGVQDSFNSRDADLILDRLKTFRDKPRALLQHLEDGFLVPEFLLSEVRRHVPDTDELTERAKYLEMKAALDKENRETFPIADGIPVHEALAIRKRRNENRAKRYGEFNQGKLFPIAFEVEKDTGRVVEGGGAGVERFDLVPLPRRFMGFFDGLWLGECVAGHCERFAVDALDGVNKHHVQRRGSYLGFTRVPTVRHGDRVLAPVEFGAPVLRQKAFTTDGPGGEKIPTSLYELWLDAASARKPKEWADFVVGSSSAINNAGVQSTVRESPSYRLRKNVAHSNDVENFDPMAKEIVGKDSTPPFGYGGRMVTEGTVGGQGNLRPIRPFTADEMDALVKGDGRIAELIQLLRQPRFASDPRSGAWGDALVERISKAPYEGAKEFVRQILTLESWSTHPRAAAWVTKLLEIPRVESRYDPDTRTYVSPDPVPLLVQEAFVSPHWVKSPQFAAWVYKLIDSGRSDLVTTYLLQREAVLEHPEAYLFLMRAGLKDNQTQGRASLPEHFTERHLQLLLANPSPAAGKLTETEWHDAAEMIFEARRIGGAQGRRASARTFAAAFEKVLLRMALVDDAAWSALTNLAFDTHNQFQGAAMEAMLEEGAKPERLEATLGIVAQYLVRKIAARPPDAREQLNRQWARLAEAAQSGDMSALDGDHFSSSTFVDTAGADPHFYANAKRVLTFAAKHRGHPSEAGFSLGIGLEAVFRRMAFDTRASTSVGSGIFALSLGRPQERPEKLELARMALQTLTEMALEQPVMLMWANQAMEHAAKVGFLDDNRSNALYRRLIEEYPEFFVDNKKGFEGDTFIELVKRRNALLDAKSDRERQTLAEEIVKPYPHLYLNSQIPMLRQVALVEVEVRRRTGGPAAATLDDATATRLRTYQERHPVEYEAVCRLVLDAYPPS